PRDSIPLVKFSQRSKRMGCTIWPVQSCSIGFGVPPSWKRATLGDELESEENGNHECQDLCGSAHSGTFFSGVGQAGSHEAGATSHPAPEKSSLFSVPWKGRRVHHQRRALRSGPQRGLRLSALPLHAKG